MLATKRSAGVTPEVKLREHVPRTRPTSANKAAHYGFETEENHQKSETVLSVATQKELLSSIFFLKKKKKLMTIKTHWNYLQWENIRK